MSKPLRGIMFDNTSGDLSNNLGLGDAALTHLTSGADNIAVGYNALQTTTTGSSNVAIGNQAASDSNYSNTITINATGNSLDTTNDSGCFVAPIRNASAAYALYYDNTTKEITWDASGGGGGGGGGGNLVSGNLLVTGTAEAKGLLLPPVQSAEGNSSSVITDLDPSTNPLMTKGMLWMNKAQDKSAGAGWGYIASLPSSRMQLGVAALEGKLYAVGGNVGSSAEVYDPIDNSWNPIASMSISRWGLGCASLMGKLYAVGGTLDNSGGGWRQDTAEVYDPSENSWKPIASMSPVFGGGRAWPGVAALGGKLYAVGGETNWWSGIKTAEVYDPIDNSWNPIASMDTSRCAPGLAALGGKLYAVGGYNGDISLASTEVYDPINNSWNYVASMSRASFKLAAAALGGKLYAVGGFGTDNVNAPLSYTLKTTEVYDPIENSWNPIAAMDISRAMLGVAALGGKLYAIGGSSSTFSSALDTVEAYTIPESLKTFSSLPTAPSTFYAPWSTATMGKVFVGGGSDAVGQTNNSMAAYDVSSGLWGPLNSQTNAGRQAACAEALGGKIYLFGGWYDGDTPADPDFGATAICCDYTTDTWTPIASMNASHTYFGSAVLGGKIYAIGSWYNTDDTTSRTVEAYDPSTNSWTNVAPMDVSRGRMNCATLLGKIYAPGGGCACIPFQCHASVEVYDPATGTWSYIAPLSATRWGAQTLAVRGKLYVVGGGHPINGNGNSTEIIPAATEVYDPMNPTQGWTTLSDTLGLWYQGGATSMGNIYLIGGYAGTGAVVMAMDGLQVSVFSDDASKWNYVAPMDVSRAYMGCATLGGKLYAVGGYAAAPNLPWRTGLVYDPIDNSWNAIAPMDVSRSYFGLAALGGKLYAVGGVNVTGSTNVLATAEVYDPIVNSWSSIAPMTMTRQRHGLTALGGKLYAVGGLEITDFATATNTLEVYDPIDNSWNQISGMNQARFNCKACALGGKIYIVGGHPGYGQESAEVYDPFENSWDMMPAPLFPTNAPAAAALGGKLYVMGGYGVVTDSSCVQIYDPLNPSGGWTYGPSMNMVRSNCGGAALGGKLYAVGGYNFFAYPDYHVNTVEAYTPPASMTPQITYQGEDFYLNASRGGPKTFVIPHPEHEGKMLRHACLEAPTRGTNVYEYQITTTEDNQITTISLPSYFKHINGSPNVFVSPKNVLSTCYGNVNDDLTAALITTEKPGTFNVMVTGVRKDPDAVAYSATECIDEPIAVEDIH